MVMEQGDNFCNMKSRQVVIKGTDRIVLNVNLQRLLKEVQGTYVENFYWGLLWIEAVVDENFPFKYIEFEREINTSGGAKVFAFNELLFISSLIKQEINMLVVCAVDENDIKQYTDDELMIKKCELVFELVDSSYWEVAYKNIVFDGLASLNNKSKLG